MRIAATAGLGLFIALGGGCGSDSASGPSNHDAGSGGSGGTGGSGGSSVGGTGGSSVGGSPAGGSGGASCGDTQTDAKNCGACGHDCLGGTCSGAACQPVVLASGFGANAIAVDATSVYAAGPSSLVKIPIAGGAPATLATTTSMIVGSIAVDATNVYFSTGTEVMKVAIAGGTPASVGPAFSKAVGLALDGTNIYVADQTAGTVTAVPLGGGSPKTLVTGETSPSAVAVDATDLFFIDATANGALKRVPLAGGAATTLAQLNTTPGSLALGPSTVYFTTIYANGGEVRSVAKGGGAPASLASNQAFPLSVAVDATNAYWVDNPGTNGVVSRVALDGGTATQLATGQNSPGSLALDATAIYWANSLGAQVMKLAEIAAAGPRGNALPAQEPSRNACAVALTGGMDYWSRLLAAASRAPNASQRTASHLLQLGGVPLATTSPAPMADLVYELRGVWQSFEADAVLRGVDLGLTRGETLGIIGPSGSGKSVLLKCMIALLPIDAGELRFEGENVPEMSNAEQMLLRQRVGFLFQSGGLFDSMTVRQNLEYALHEQFFRSMSGREMHERVAWALAAVGLPLSEGDTMPADLSGGMQKRVGIARTIITRPKVVLYDEPTQGLDPPNAHRISDLMLALRDELGLTAVIVSHDLRTVYTVCDRVAFMNAGRVLETGRPPALAESENSLVRDFVTGHPPEEVFDPRDTQPPEPWK